MWRPWLRHLNLLCWTSRVLVWPGWTCHRWSFHRMEQQLVFSFVWSKLQGSHQLVHRWLIHRKVWRFQRYLLTFRLERHSKLHYKYFTVVVIRNSQFADQLSLSAWGITVEDNGNFIFGLEFFVSFLINWHQWVSGFLQQPIQEIFFRSLAVEIDLFSLVEEEDGWISLNFVFTSPFAINGSINFG